MIIQKIKKYMTALAILSAFLLSGLTPFVGTSLAAAATDANGCVSNSISSGIASGANSVGAGGVSCNDNKGCAAGVKNCTTDSATNSIESLASNIVNIFSIIVGIVSVIMIIYGGFRYITSGGDSNAVGGAKNTIVYAVIGLVIVALAQMIVHFVLNQTSLI